MSRKLLHARLWLVENISSSYCVIKMNSSSNGSKLKLILRLFPKLVKSDVKFIWNNSFLPLVKSVQSLEELNQFLLYILISTTWYGGDSQHQYKKKLFREVRGSRRLEINLSWLRTLIDQLSREYMKALTETALTGPLKIHAYENWQNS